MWVLIADCPRSLFPWLTVKGNVEFGLLLRGTPPKERTAIAENYIAGVGLTGFEDEYPMALSGGMKQRVALARALANDPKVLLMDEPFGSLDSQTRILMQELLLRVWENSHKTVFFITHDIDEAIFLGDRVHVMSARPGRLKAAYDVGLARPRGLDVLTTPPFMELKRTIMEDIRVESMKVVSEPSIA